MKWQWLNLFLGLLIAIATYKFINLTRGEARLQCAENCEIGITQPEVIVNKEVELRNVGTKTLSIRKIEPGCHCVLINNSEFITQGVEIKPASSYKFTFRLKTPPKLGHYQQVIAVSSNDSVNPTTLITLTGKNEETLSILPHRLSYFLGDETDKGVCLRLNKKERNKFTNLTAVTSAEFLSATINRDWASGEALIKILLDPLLCPSGEISESVHITYEIDGSPCEFYLPVGGLYKTDYSAEPSSIFFEPKVGASKIIELSKAMDKKQLNILANADVFNVERLTDSQVKLVVVGNDKQARSLVGRTLKVEFLEGNKKLLTVPVTFIYTAAKFSD